jgi:chorismate mutase
VDKEKRLEVLRGHIEDISHDIITLIEYRTRMARQLGDIKRDLGLTPYNPEREQLLLTRLQTRSTLPPQLVEDIFTLIFGSSVKIQADK